MKRWRDLTPVQQELAVRQALGILMCCDDREVTWETAEREAKRAIYVENREDEVLVIPLDPCTMFEPTELELSIPVLAEEPLREFREEGSTEVA